MRKLISPFAVVVCSVGFAHAASIDACGSIPVDTLPSVMRATDPVLLRVLLGQYAKSCPTQVGKAKALLNRRSTSNNGTISEIQQVITGIEYRSRREAIDPFRLQIGDLGEDGQLSSYSDLAIQNSGGTPPVVSVIAAGVSYANRTVVSDAATSVNASLAVNNVGRKLADSVVNALRKGAVGGSGSGAINFLFGRIDEASIKGALLKEAYLDDATKQILSYSGKSEIDELNNVSVVIEGIKIPMSTIISSVKDGTTKPLETFLASSTLATQVQDNSRLQKIEVAVRPIRFLIEECLKSKIAAGANGCSEEHKDVVYQRLARWVTSQRDAITTSALSALKARRDELELSFAKDLAQTGADGEVRRRVVLFLSDPKQTDVKSLIVDVIRLSVRNNGISGRSAQLIEAIACTDSTAAAVIGCKQRELQLESLRDGLLAILPEGSQERTFLEAALQGRLADGRPVSVSADTIVIAAKEALLSASKSLAKGVGNGSEIGSSDQLRALTGAAMVAVIGSATQGAERLLEEQQSIVKTLKEQVDRTGDRIAELNASLAELPKFARLRLDEFSWQANQQIEKLRGSLTIGVSELAMINNRLIGAKSSFDERLDGMRLLLNSEVAKLMPNDVKRTIGENIEIVKGVESSWKALSTAYNDPSISNVGAAVTALKLLPMGENERKALDSASQALSAYSAATAIFAMSNPMGMAIAGFGFMSSGGGPFSGAFGGGNSGPDPAVMAELRAISQKLDVIEKKIDNVLTLQQETIRRVGQLSADISRNQVDVMRVIFEIRTLQEQTLERLNFYGSKWTRNCSAVGAAMSALGISDVADPRAWEVLKADVDNVVECVGGMQTFVQNARDGKTYAARLISSILPSAADECRAQLNSADDNQCERYRDWAVTAYETTWSKAIELKLVPAGSGQELRQFLWRLSNPSIDVQGLDAQLLRYTSLVQSTAARKGHESGAVMPTAEPFSPAVCGEPPDNLRSVNRSLSNIEVKPTFSSDVLSVTGLMAAPIAPEWIVDHVTKVVEYHNLINLRPFLRSNAIDLDLKMSDPHAEGAWALLCNARIAVQLATVQQAVLSGDALLPQLYGLLIDSGEQPSTSVRAAAFDLFRSNRMFARNFILYALSRELDRFGDRLRSRAAGGGKSVGSCTLPQVAGSPCLREVPRSLRNFDFARKLARYGDDSGNACGASLTEALPTNNEDCAMTRLLPRLRGERELEAERGRDERGYLSSTSLPMIRYVARPFLVREPVGTSFRCRLEPGQSWYFVWPKGIDASPEKDITYVRKRGSNSGQDITCDNMRNMITANGKPFWDDISQEALPDKKWLWDVIDADALYVSALPSTFEIASGFLKRAPIASSLVSLEKRLIGAQQTARELAFSNVNSGRADFIWSALAGSRP